MSKPKKLKPLPWRKLSEEAGHPKTIEACQCCGRTWDVTVYIECDEADRETSVAIAVCDDCARIHVEPHPRLYLELEHNRPFPGAMSTCVDCPHRSGLTCTHHLLTTNGGPGLVIRANNRRHVSSTGRRKSLASSWTTDGPSRSALAARSFPAASKRRT